MQPPAGFRASLVRSDWLQIAPFARDVECGDNGIRKVVLLREVAVEGRTSDVKQGPMKEMKLLGRMPGTLAKAYGCRISDPIA